MKLITLLASIILSLSSCKPDPLSKQDARIAIEEYFKINSSGSTAAIEAFAKQGKGYKERIILLSDYIDRGLLKLKAKVKYPATDSLYWETYEITEKGRPYLVKEEKNQFGFSIYTVRISGEHINDINTTRYSPDKKEAVLKFTLESRSTPFTKKKDVARPRLFLIGFLKLVENKWVLYQFTPDMDHILAP